MSCGGGGGGGRREGTTQSHMNGTQLHHTSSTIHKSTHHAMREGSRGSEGVGLFQCVPLIFCVWCCGEGSCHVVRIEDRCLTETRSRQRGDMTPERGERNTARHGWAESNCTNERQTSMRTHTCTAPPHSRSNRTSVR